MDKNSYNEMLQTIQDFHDKHDFKNTGGEDLHYRIALMTEELAEESVDLLILLMEQPSVLILT